MPTVSRDPLSVSAGGNYAARQASISNSNTEDIISADNIQQTKDRRFATDKQLTYLDMVIEKFSDDENGNLSVEYAERASDAEFAREAGAATNADHADTADYAEEAGKVNWSNIRDIPEPINDATFNEQFTTLREHDHEHLNWDTIDFIDEDEEGKVTYKDSAWPYAENSNHAEIAEEANAIEWNKVKNIPEELEASYKLKDKVDLLWSNKHSHEDKNKEALDLIGKTDDDDQLPTWNGMKWPGQDGDMRSEVYVASTNPVGVVNEAMRVKWEGTSEGRPETFPPENHTHSFNDIETDDTHLFVKKSEKASWNSMSNAITELRNNKLDKSKEGIPEGYAPLNNLGKINNEFLDINWNDIKGKPNAKIEDISAAAEQKHVHTDLNALNKISEDVNELPTWKSATWPYPGDMTKDEFMEEPGVVKKAKVAEKVAWNKVDGKPMSTVSDIDNAVTNSHTHENIEALSKIKEVNGLPKWGENEWPYNMSKSEYADASNPAGVVNRAKIADSVNWENINGRPDVTIEQIEESMHTHLNKVNTLDDIYHNDEKSRLTYRGNEVALLSDIENAMAADTANTSGSITVVNGKYQLVGDAPVSNNSYYGTNSTGDKGFHILPEVEVRGSLQKDSNGKISLKNDNTPEIMNYYGTNKDGELGYHEFPNENKDKVLPTSIRQSVIAAGNATFMVADTTDGTLLKVIASPGNPIVINFANSKNDIIKSLTELKEINITEDSYIYAEIINNDDNEEINISKTTIKPIYSKERPSNPNTGQYWFDINNYIMKKYDGTNFENTLAVFIGYVEYNSAESKIGIIHQFAVNGFYDSGYYDAAYGSSINKNHNIGTDLLFITAYKATNGTNNQLFESAISANSPSDANIIGDNIKSINEFSIRTCRNAMGTYTPSDFYGTTNQHRVIIRRAF